MSQRNVISRRRFLSKSGAALGAAVAFPNFIPAPVLGRGGARAPSERITMGFIGVGGQGAGHLLGGAWTYLTGGYAARKDVQVLATCDVRRQRREFTAQKVNDHYREVYGPNFTPCQAYDDFRHVLDRPDIDAVLIATPAHWHATMAVMAAQAGKDLYCEKPSAVTIGEAQQMCAAVARYGRVYQAGTQQRCEYGGKFRMACEFIRSGRIGKLHSIYAYRDGGGIFWPLRFGPGKPVPDGLDWDLYLGPMPWFPYDGDTGPHRFDIGELNWGQHHYDIVQWAADADATGPVELFMQDNRFLLQIRQRRRRLWQTLSGRTGRRRRRRLLCRQRRPHRRGPRQPGFRSAGHRARAVASRTKCIFTAANSHSGNFLECIRTRQRTICNAEIALRSVQRLAPGRHCQTIETHSQVGPGRPGVPRRPGSQSPLDLRPAPALERLI